MAKAVKKTKQPKLKTFRVTLIRRKIIDQERMVDVQALDLKDAEYVALTLGNPLKGRWMDCENGESVTPEAIGWVQDLLT